MVRAAPPAENLGRTFVPSLRPSSTAPTAHSLPRARPSGMLAIGSFVADLTGKAFARYGFSAAGLITDWVAIAGRDLAAYARPERLRGRGGASVAAGKRKGATLVLRVDG